jgi:phytoene synthase
MTVSPADLARCRQMIRDGSKTFYMASLLLPERVRDPALSLYAFCREADDAVDKSSDSARAVAELQARLDDIYQRRPGPSPADRAFTDVVTRFSIPRALPEALIEGFAWDAEGRTYHSISDLRSYGVRVAGTVGVMMSLIMGAREPAALARAADLGVAMQFTNIARDVGEDARNGRVYLPISLLEANGLAHEALLSDPKPSPALARVIAAVLDEADRLYGLATSGISYLPAACRPAIHASRLLYAEIGREVERLSYNSVSHRAVVSTRRKSMLMASAITAAVLKSDRSAVPALPEAQFLLDAIADAEPPEASPRSVEEKAAWVINLFLRLEGQRS